MFSDPQFWVAVAFFAFIAAVFNPIRKILTTNLDSQIKDIKDKIFDKKKVILKAKKYLKKYSLKDTVDLIFEIEKINKKKIYQLCLKVKNEKDY